MGRVSTSKNNHSTNNQKSNITLEHNRIENKIEYALKALERTDSWIDNCDNKMSVLLGALGIMLTILVTTESISKACGFILRLFEDINLHNGLFLIAFFIVIIFYIITAVHIVNTVFARIDNNRYIQKKMSKKSNVFFGSISELSFDEYKNSFIHETAEEQINDILSQIYINSVIARRKYKNYNRSLKWSVISISLTIVVVIWALVGF